MTAFNHCAGLSPLSLTAALDRYSEAGIDPLFDADCEELEREFAELRLTFNDN